MRIRAALRLGFFAFAGLGCAPPSPEALARAADTHHRTEAFTWLVSHRPAALVVRHVDPDAVSAIVPQSAVVAATGDACAQAKTRHAAIFLLARGGVERERVLGCGVALFRDAGAVVVAPL